MKKLRLRNIIIFILVFVGLSGIILGIDLTLNKPTTLNKIVATKLYKEPANKAFTDQNFYNCVVDAYNEENYTNVAYTENLTDEQLQSITRLYCVNEYIYILNGIEKLTSLTKLDLTNNYLSSIDLSSNTSLTKLVLYGNNLSSIDLSKNTALTELYLGWNNLSSIDVSENPALTDLKVAGNNLTEIDLSKNTKLTDLD